MLPAAFELELYKLISLALNDLLSQETDLIPFDSLSHTNKKVGRNAHSKTRTIQEYRCHFALKQPPFPYVCFRIGTGNRKIADWVSGSFDSYI